MALKIYKPGQGYWTRMSSGVGAGVLAGAGILWLWDELSTIHSQYTLYIQGGVAAALVGLFGLMIIYWVGIKPKTCDFLIATEGEMRKVNWPGQRELVGSTWVVICCTALFAALLFVSDFIFAWFFTLVHVLER